MKTQLFVAFAAIGLLTTSQLAAQVMLSPAFRDDDSVKSIRSQADADLQSVPTITLRGKSASDPLLQYRLWPAPEDRQRRNGMQIVNRAIILSGQIPEKEKREFDSWHQELKSERLDGFPVAEAKRRLAPYGTVLSELKRCENWMEVQYDLGMDGLTTSEKISTLLPEYQEFRSLARMLSLRARVAATEGRWFDAVADLRLGFRLSEFACQSSDLLIGRLIGIAVAEHMMDTIETLIQHPDCPNLYWSLVAVPVDRIVDMRAAIETEAGLISHIGALTGTPELPSEIIGEQAAIVQIKRAAKAIDSLLETHQQNRQSLPLLELSAAMYVATMEESSRELLAGNPLWQDRVDKLSAAEVVLRASDLQLRRVRDRWLAWSLLPQDVWEQYATERAQAFTPARDTLNPSVVVANLMLPAVDRAIKVGYRARQRHHHLLTLEAIRMHAAVSGTLPASLDGLKPVPAWKDSLAGKPFQYIRSSPTEAVLSRTPRFENDPEVTLIIQLEK